MLKLFVLWIQDNCKRCAGPSFRLLLDRGPPAKLKTIIRQRKKWQQRATQLFGQGKPKQALELYRDKGHIKLFKNPHPILEKWNAGKKFVDSEHIQAHLL